MDIYLIFKALVKRIWLILGMSVVAVVATFIFTSDYEREFKSTAQLSTGFTIKDKLTEEGYFNIYEANTKFDNLIETITSPTVIGLVSYDLLLHDIKSNTPFRKPDVKYKITAPISSSISTILQNKLDSIQVLTSFDKKEKIILEILHHFNYDFKSLEEMITIKRVNRTDFVAIECISENPELSAYIVNTLCKLFFFYNETLRVERSNESVHFFSKLANQKRQELEEKSEMLRQFKSNQGVINFNVESESKIGQIAKYEAALDEEQKKQRSLLLSIDNLDERLRDARNGNPRTASNSNARILTIKKNISDLNDRYIETGSNNQELSDEIKLLRSELNQLLSEMNQYSGQKNEIQNLAEEKNKKEVDLKIAIQNIQSLTSTLNRLRNNVGIYASKEAQIQELEREVQLASDEYFDAQQKYNTAFNVSSAAGNNIRQVLFGQPAVEPEPSQRLIITGLTGATTFVLMLISIFFMEYLDFSIKTPSYFAKNVNLKLIGKLIQINEDTIYQRFFKIKQKAKQQTIFKELLKKIRYEIENSDKKVILFSSTKPGEGKTLIIEYLLHTMSLSRKKLLVLDTNFSHASLTNHYKAAPALEKLLNSEQMPTEEEVIKFITPTDISGVDVLGCKGGMYSPYEILNNKTFTKALDLLKNKYDYIFMEGAALNSYPDSKELLHFADGLISIFSARSVIKQSDKETIEYLQHMNGKFLGAILNNIETENMDL